MHLFLNNNLYAGENIISSISIDGMQRIDEETIVSYAGISLGDIYTEEIGNKALKSLFGSYSLATPSTTTIVF